MRELWPAAATRSWTRSRRRWRWRSSGSGPTDLVLSCGDLRLLAVWPKDRHMQTFHSRWLFCVRASHNAVLEYFHYPKRSFVPVCRQEHWCTADDLLGHQPRTGTMGTWVEWLWWQERGHTAQQHRRPLPKAALAPLPPNVPFAGTELNAEPLIWCSFLRTAAATCRSVG